MKRIINFSKAYILTTVISLSIIIAGIAGYVINGGFNLGVDFQAGLMQEVQFAPTAFKLRYTGAGTAGISMDRNKLEIVVSGAAVESTTFSFPFAEYATLGALLDGLSVIEGMQTAAEADADTPSTILIQSSQGNPRLSSEPYAVHYLPESAPPIEAERVRSALSSLEGVSVQVLGREQERKFLIRVEDKGSEEGFALQAAERISRALVANFGEGQVAVARTDYVGARFSKHLTDQAGLLVSLTLLLILIYASIRFKLQYAISAVLAIAHDALIMIAFIAWSRMEFNTITIAAILTILGYSINDTIVIFDRIRETIRLYPDDSFQNNMNRALTETLGRTIITTVTTILAVLSLFIFTTGSMKDFSLALLIGMTSGVYSSIFIASAFVLFWEKMARKRSLKKAANPAVTAATKA